MSDLTAERMLAEMPADFDDLFWNQRKGYVLRIVDLCRELGFKDPAANQLTLWEQTNLQRYPFSLPALARFVANQQDEVLSELYQYVSRTFANSMYNIQSDSIQTVINHHLGQPGGLPDIFWEGFVRDVDPRTLARLGRELPNVHVGPVLTRLFQLEKQMKWGQPYLHLYHLYITQRNDEFGMMTWDYLEALYKPEDADSLV